MDKVSTYLLEFLGTYLFILAILLDMHILVIAVVFTLVGLLGAHANPLITVAKFLGQLDKKDPLPFLAIQVLAALLALASVKMIKKNKGSFPSLYKLISWSSGSAASS